MRVYSTACGPKFRRLFSIPLSIILVGEISQNTPPVGFNLFIFQGLTGTNILRVAVAALPFFFLLLLGALIVTAFPGIVTLLPNAMGN